MLPHNIQKWVWARQEELLRNPKGGAVTKEAIAGITYLQGQVLKSGLLRFDGMDVTVKEGSGLGDVDEAKLRELLRECISSNKYDEEASRKRGQKTWFPGCLGQLLEKLKDEKKQRLTTNVAKVKCGLWNRDFVRDNEQLCDDFLEKMGIKM